MNSKTTLFSKISNIIFLLTSIFCLFFLWTNIYTKNIITSLYSSIIVVFAFSIIYYPLKLKNIQHKKNYKSNIKKKEYTKNQFIFGNNKKIKDFLINLFQIKNFTTITDNHIILSDKKLDIFFFFDKILTDNNLNTVYKNTINQNIEIYCLASDNNLTRLKNINLEIIDFEIIYKICIKNNKYLDLNIEKKETKYTLKDILCVVFSRNRSKSYFWLAFLLLFSSLFTPYNIYYMVCSSILFILAIYSKFNKRFNQHNTCNYQANVQI